MSHEHDTSGPTNTCAESECSDDAAFFVYVAETEDWRPICTSHARHLHPSLEVHVWLESGYMKPVELGEPNGLPSDPYSARARAFRREVERTMEWCSSIDSL